MTRDEAVKLIARLDYLESEARSIEVSLTRIRRELQDQFKINTWDYKPAKTLTGIVSITTRPKPNIASDGALACMYGTPWLDHFQSPLGTGKGCMACDKATE